MNSTRRRLLIFAIVAALAAFAWYTITLPLQRSHYIVLSRAAAEAIIEHIQRYQEWPSSWAELRRVPLKPPFDDGYDTVEQKVHIDFGLSLEEVAAMDPASFDAIRNKGRPYADYLDQWQAERLVAAARAAAEVSGAESREP